MATKYLPKDRLRWTEGYLKIPIWAREPDISVIKSVATSILKLEHPADDFDHLKVQYFAGGANNKIYGVEHSSWTRNYLFRVSLPVDPVNKTESEIATLNYLRRNTMIPVPRRIAWDSSSENELDFEWILLETLDGATVGSVWRTMPWDAKLTLAKDLASIFSQLWSQRFDSIGSLLLNRESNKKEGSAGGSTASSRCLAQDITKDSFSVSTVVTPPFFEGRRLYVPSNRGPYKFSHDWLQAMIELERNFT